MYQDPYPEHRPETEDQGFFADRRQFLAALAAGSAGLLMGAPSFAAASGTYPLQRQVVELLTRLRNQGALPANEKTSWSVYDFTARKKLVSINESVPRQAASMIKPFVAQAYFFQASQSSRVRYTDDVRLSMQRMIQHSSNPETNRIMDLVSRNHAQRGPRDVEAVLKSHAPGVFKETSIVERIPEGGRTYRNLASAQDYSRFLFSVWQDRLPYSQELKRLMGLRSNDRLTSGVAALPQTVRVYHKTGSTSMLCGDMGVLEVPDQHGRPHAYTLVGIIERPTRADDYMGWMRARGNIIRRVSNLVYLDMKERYRLV